MQFSPDADTAAFRNGKEVVRGGAGGEQLASLQQQTDKHQHQLDALRLLVHARVQEISQLKTEMDCALTGAHEFVFTETIASSITSALASHGMPAAPIITAQRGPDTGPPQGVSQQTPPSATILRAPGLEQSDPVLAASTHEEE